MWGRNPSSLQYVTSGAPENSAAANSSDHLSAGRQQQSDGKEKWPLFHISFSFWIKNPLSKKDIQLEEEWAKLIHYPTRHSFSLFIRSLHWLSWFVQISMPRKYNTAMQPGRGQKWTVRYFDDLTPEKEKVLWTQRSLFCDSVGTFCHVTSFALLYRMFS